MENYEIDNIILKRLSQSASIANTLELAEELNMKHTDLDAKLKSLLVDDYIELKVQENREIKLSAEGLKYAEEGAPEVVLLRLLKQGEKIEKKEVEGKFEKKVAKIAFAKAMKNKWIKADKTHVEQIVADEEVKDTTQASLKEMLENIRADQHDKKILTDMKKRKLLQIVSIKFYAVTKGINYREERVALEAELTADMLRDGSWKSKDFKRVNTKAMGANPDGGHLHPLLKVRSLFKEILTELGFEEMPTNRFVESSFWNFDCLFQPQQHPARDSHDTFFLKDPPRTLSIPEDYLQKVKNIHENGGYGSIGYDYEWSEDEARKNVLRTHTTAVSSQLLYKLAQEKEFKPKKYFSIDRVFRNETLDATHLAEFHQVEGVVADYNLGLGNLIGMFEAFFKKIGIDKLKFKPAYNPYTEPSLEIFGYHPTLKKWVELGNSGVFRPEMLRPMGLPEDVTVIAWGLSLERPTMIYYDIDNIRDLFGHKVDLSRTKENKVCYMRPK